MAHKEGKPEKYILNGKEHAPGLIDENELTEDSKIVVIM